jgi:hypothetical protein
MSPSPTLIRPFAITTGRTIALSMSSTTTAPLGAVIAKKTAQGFADSSAWARGQAWGLYGFTMVYRATHDARYLAQAEHIAHFLLTNPKLPADKIPYWDYDAPGIPANGGPSGPLRDASAAAIMASALIELSHYVQPRRSPPVSRRSGTDHRHPFFQCL